MRRLKYFLILTGFLCISFVLIFSACGSSPSSGQQSGAGASSKGRPAWVTNVESVYSKGQYVTGVGTGSSRVLAERNALAALVSFFGQEIQVDLTVSNLYQEAVRSGVTSSWSDTTTVDSTISTSSSLDSLVGAEIKEVWDDSKGNHYAVAVMDRAKTVMIYNDMIRSNLSMINNLTNMTQAEKNTLEGFSRYQFAAAIADINVSYGNVLKVIGAPALAESVRGNDYRLEAAEIVKSIPIAVTVRGDRQGRVQGAISKALADLGFRSGGTNSRYIVDAELTITEDVYPNSPYKWARYVVNANLMDTVPSRVTLVPFSISDREGQTTFDLAVNRALSKVEDKIAYDFNSLVNDYLFQALPKK